MKKAIYYLRGWATILLVMSFISVSAQTIKVDGLVTASDDGSTMVGVSIVQKGTQLGTITDLDGKYTITVPTGSVLVFSYVGYLTVEIVANKPVINVTMKPSVAMLDEVITIGYATQKKSDKTGAVSNVKADELNAGVITDPIQAMQGKVAGVSITKKGGDPNEGFSVRIRGASGFAASTQPLYVIDGVPGADPTTIASEDIESYNILKDAASTAIYGSRGSNGVIIITTKKGKVKGPGSTSAVSQVNFSTQVSMDVVAKKLDLLSSDQLRGFVKDNLLPKAQVEHPEYTVDSIFNDGGSSTDWQDEIYRTGITNTNNLSFTGGTAKSFYYASLTNSGWNGVMEGTSKKRNTARINLTHFALDDKLTFNANYMGSFENNDKENYDGWDKDDIIYQALQRNPTDPVYASNGDYYKTSRVFNYENPVSIINEVDNKRELKSFLGSLKTDYKIIDGLVASLNLGYTNIDQTHSYFRPSGLYSSADNGSGEKKAENKRNKILEFTGNYDKSFKDIHNFNFLLGYSWQETENSGFFAKGNDAQSDYIGSDNLAIFNELNYGDIGSWKSQSTLIGYFGRVQYNMNHKYYASASLRRDGSSKFGENNKWGWFPTAAVGWNMEQEGFLQGVDWIDQLKLRVSYGVSGNQEIGEYRSMVVWEPAGKATNPETGQEVITFKPAWNANPDLKWEETAEFNIGIDYALFDSKISGSLEIYQKNTTDLLGEYTVPVPPNLAQKTFANSGELENKGIEFFIQTYAISNKNFLWKTNLNLSHNNTIINDLGEYFNEEDGVRKEGYISGRGMVGDEYYVIGMMEGEEIGAFYLPTYVTIQNGKFIYESKNGGFTDNLSDAKRTIVGYATPDLEIGWSNSMTYRKNWHLDFSFRAMIGNDVYNATEMFFDNPGNLPSLNATPAAIDWYEKGRSSGSSLADFYVENATFLRLDYVSLSYDFNFSKSKAIKGLTAFVSSNNLLTITGYSGVDPETKIDGLGFGIDQYNVYPKTRTFTFGIRGTL